MFNGLLPQVAAILENIDQKLYLREQNIRKKDQLKQE
jgi:hypothetical protein